VSKVDKSGRTVCIAFAQFSSTWFATRCLKMVQARAHGPLMGQQRCSPSWSCINTNLELNRPTPTRGIRTTKYQATLSQAAHGDCSRGCSSLP